MGISAWWWVGSAGIGSLLLALWIGPRIWRVATQNGLYTVGDYLELRYGSAVRATVATLLWFLTLIVLAAQLIAMLLDFVPESMAMGAMLATGKAAGFLLAVLIALQNFPEGFNAYRELRAAGRHQSWVVLAFFCGLALLGPLAALAGHLWLRDVPWLLGFIMLFAAGGILYLTFQDIAPQARLDRHWAPPLGAVAGFMLGLLGAALVP